jgi:steroid delta-isomerase-like uncharacterized protein
MSADNKAIIRRLYEEVFNKGNLALVEELFSPTYVRHDPAIPELRGLTGAKQICTMIRTAFPDIHCTLEDLVAEGDKVVLRWSARATHQGDFVGVAGTGKPVTMSGTETWLIREGKLQEEWAHWDTLGLLRQVGVIPE